MQALWQVGATPSLPKWRHDLVFSPRMRTHSTGAFTKSEMVQASLRCFRCKAHLATFRAKCQCLSLWYVPIRPHPHMCASTLLPDAQCVCVSCVCMI